jgi:hypothetical protein
MPTRKGMETPVDELYALESPLQVLLVTGVLGGGAAFLAGRAIAQTWRPFWHVLIYMAMLGAAVRFVHFALFESILLSPASYCADALYLIAVGSLAWRVTRAAQMATQYYWLYERTGPLTWRARSPAEVPVGNANSPR